MTIKNVLSIAGTDPTGGAGIHADLKAFSARAPTVWPRSPRSWHRTRAVCASFMPLDPSFVGEQIDADARRCARRRGKDRYGRQRRDRRGHRRAPAIPRSRDRHPRSGDGRQERDRLLDDDGGAIRASCHWPRSSPRTSRSPVLLDTTDVTRLGQMEDEATGGGLGCQWDYSKAGISRTETLSVDHSRRTPTGSPPTPLPGSKPSTTTAPAAPCPRRSPHCCLTTPCPKALNGRRPTCTALSLPATASTSAKVTVPYNTSTSSGRAGRDPEQAPPRFRSVELTTSTHERSRDDDAKDVSRRHHSKLSSTPTPM